MLDTTIPVPGGITAVHAPAERPRAPHPAGNPAPPRDPLPASREPMRVKRNPEGVPPQDQQQSDGAALPPVEWRDDAGSDLMRTIALLKQNPELRGLSNIQALNAAVVATIAEASGLGAPAAMHLQHGGAGCQHGASAAAGTSANDRHKQPCASAKPSVGTTQALLQAGQLSDANVSAAITLLVHRARGIEGPSQGRQKRQKKQKN